MPARRAHRAPPVVPPRGEGPGVAVAELLDAGAQPLGTAPKYSGKDMVNPGSIILSAEMMLRHLGWFEAADLILRGMDGAIRAKRVTYDFARLMKGAKQVSCSAFGEAIIRQMAGRAAPARKTKKKPGKPATRKASKTKRPARTARKKTKRR